MYLLIRHNSAYTCRDILLGVFTSPTTVDQGRQAYIDMPDPISNQTFFYTDLVNDIETRVIHDVNTVNQYAEIWLEYASGFGQDIVSFHSSKDDIKPCAFTTDIEVVLYEIDKLYDGVQVKLPDIHTQFDIDRCIEDEASL